MKYFIEQYLNRNSTSFFIGEHSQYSFKKILEIAKIHSENLKVELPQKAKCAVLCNQEINAAIAVLSGWLADLVIIPLSKKYGMKHCEKILSFVEPDIIITDEKISREWTLRQYNIITGEFSCKSNTFHMPEPILKDAAVIMCTSGTTGIPKGVVLSAKGLKKNANNILKYFPLKKQDKIIIARPLYHCAVLTGEFLVSIIKGCNIYFFENQYNPFMLWRKITDEKINVMCGTPTLMKHLSTICEKHNQTNVLALIAISGEVLTKRVAEDINKTFNSAEIFNVYGLTEAGPRVSYLPCAMFEKIPESVGIPLEEVEIRVVNDTESMLEKSVNETGYVIVKTACIMKGYYRDDKLSDKVIKKGWLNTGDLGYKDKDGRLYIVSRTDDMIIKAGMNIYPAEIENILLANKAINQVVAYGVKENFGWSIGIDVVLEKDYYLTRKDIMAICRNSLPEYQIPNIINVVDELKRNASGKLIRKRNNNG